MLRFDSSKKEADHWIERFAYLRQHRNEVANEVPIMASTTREKRFRVATLLTRLWIMYPLKRKRSDECPAPGKKRCFSFHSRHTDSIPSSLHQCTHSGPGMLTGPLALGPGKDWELGGKHAFTAFYMLPWVQSRQEEVLTSIYNRRWELFAFESRYYEVESP